MPFSKLDKAWSNLAEYYNTVTKDGVFAGSGNVTYTSKPEFPSLRYSLFDDGLIRGGAINVGLSTLRDTARIGKFFASGKGALFITKQVGLQLSNPKLEQEPPTNSLPTSGQGVLQNVVNTVTNFVNKRSPNQIYNLGLNTLAQVPLTAAGGHIIRHGILPIGGGGFLNGTTDNIKGYNYEKIAKANNEASRQAIKQFESTSTAVSNFSSARITSGVNTNSIKEFSSNVKAGTGTGINNAIPTGDLVVNQVGGSMFTDSQGYIKEKGLAEIIVKVSKSESRVVPQSVNYILSYSKAPNRLLQYLKTINTDTTFGFSNEKTLVLGPVTLQDYNGGANSVYGIGKTFIKTYPDQRTNVSTNKEEPKKELLNGFLPKPYSILDELSTKLSSDRKEKKYINPNNPYNIEDRIGVSKIGEIKKLDSINIIDVTNSVTFYSASLQPNSSADPLKDYTGQVDGFFGRDIIKFRIEFLDNNASSVKTDVLAFRAYIDDFQDGMNAKWNSYRYMGRGEDFYVYDGFTRDISVAFTIFAHSPKEMKPIYRKLNYLMSSFAPDYSEYNKMRGNIGYLTVGDYIYRQPGIFTDIKLSGMLDSHWEIALNEPENGSDKGQYELPKYIKVNLSFKPIHTFLPRKVQKGKDGNNMHDETPFITPDRKAYPEYAGSENKFLS